MRHRIKKIPSLISHHKIKDLLHSDKRTYFYKHKLDQFFNLSKWSSSSVGPSFTFPKKPSAAQRSEGEAARACNDRPRERRVSWEGELGLKSQTKLNTIPLLLSSLALLVVLGVMIFPNLTNTTHALEESGEVEDAGANNSASINAQSITIPENGVALTIDSTPTATENGVPVYRQQVTGEGTQYITVNFSVGANNINQYRVFVQADNSTLTGPTSGDQIVSIGAENTAATNIGAKQWGYRVAKGADIAASSLTYDPIQTNITKPADTVKATSGNLTNISQAYTLAFAANLSGAGADHYQSNVTLSVAAGASEVANLYSVTYEGNGNTGGVIPPMQYATSDNTTYTFTTPTAAQYRLAKTSYGLLGWSENPNAITATYEPGSIIMLDSDNPTKTLYAVWHLTLSSLTTMQDMNSTYCKVSNLYESKQLTDTRDNNSYWVTKLNDGNCWMTQNLDYNIKSTGITRDELAKTDLTTAWTSSSTNKPVVTSTTVFSSTANNLVASYDPGKNKFCSNNTTDACNLTTSKNNGHDAQGNYYTWQAATAGTGPADAGEAAGSICPKNWRLPSNKSGIAPTFAELGLTTSNTLSSPYFLTYSGMVNKSALSYAGGSGYHWSSTAGTTSYAYSLYFYSTNVNPSYSNNRYLGLSVRCVAR